MFSIFLLGKYQMSHRQEYIREGFKGIIETKKNYNYLRPSYLIY